MFELFKDAAGEWRWRLKAPNGNILADSAEGYRRRHNAAKAIAALKRIVPGAPVVEVLPMKGGADG
jgi:uncharacterized protein YegP (UPF0339 family)